MTLSTSYHESDLFVSSRHQPAPSIDSLSPPDSPDSEFSHLSAVRLTKPTPHHSPSSSSFDHLPLFPHHPLSWLQHVVVELWIDQEGFRQIRPQFKLARYLPPLPRADPSATLLGHAEFLPVVRHSYHFHYSPLDAPPVLRRLTLNGSQTFDHISRQAHLNLKSNGVYILNGEEDKGRAAWKFEYVVHDRRNRAGKVISGEKMFIPLSFSCSPEILTPEHGKKIRLLHVMRKSVVPKLSSLKLEPPHLPPLDPSIRPHNELNIHGTALQHTLTIDSPYDEDEDEAEADFEGRDASIKKPGFSLDSNNLPVQQSGDHQVDSAPSFPYRLINVQHSVFQDNSRVR